MAAAGPPPIDPSRLQEGNDIYLTCRLDANPRPSKPIVWRFAPRPDALGANQTGAGGQQQQLLNSVAATNPMVVLSNQSLVLRKATRHQSGDYTCESQNQHGAQVSAPLALQIRYAPVCATSDM